MPLTYQIQYVCLVALQARLLGEFHVGAITGAAALWDGQRIATCSDDGTLRIWSTALSRCIARRTFSSAQTWVLEPPLSWQSNAVQSEQGCPSACSSKVLKLSVCARLFTCLFKQSSAVQCSV